MGTGRHNKSSNNFKGLSSKTTIDITSKVLGKKLAPIFERITDRTNALKIVNPNYLSGSDKYRTNCALCTTAGALQLMGYDVEAMPRDTTWRGFDSVFDYKWTPENFKSPKNVYKNYSGVDWDANYRNTNRFTGSRREDISKEIQDQMKSWGDKSFAAMNVSWKGGSAHVVVVCQNGDKSSIVDFQTHHEYSSVDSWFAAHPSAVLNSIGLYRLDNQSIKSNIPNIHKIIKKRGT